jgi:hypothetical protein
MQFIRLPRQLDIAEIELLELVIDQIYLKSVQNIIISFIQKLRENMQIS